MHHTPWLTLNILELLFYKENSTKKNIQYINFISTKLSETGNSINFVTILVKFRTHLFVDQNMMTNKK